MKLVIDIPDKVYSYLRQECTVLDDGYDSPINHMVHSILHGVILPKGHGDLIDREVLKSKFSGDNVLNVTLRKCFDEIESVIEADEEEE